MTAPVFVQRRFNWSKQETISNCIQMVFKEFIECTNSLIGILRFCIWRQYIQPTVLGFYWKILECFRLPVNIFMQKNKKWSNENLLDKRRSRGFLHLRSQFGDIWFQWLLFEVFTIIVKMYVILTSLAEIYKRQI